MKTWTNAIAPAATLAALLTLAACQPDNPGRIVGSDDAAPSEESEFAELLLVTLPAQYEELEAALEEMKRTFTAEDYRQRLWEKRWPKIWGPNGWDSGHHAAPPHPLNQRDIESSLAAWQQLHAEAGLVFDEEMAASFVAEIEKDADAEVDRFLQELPARNRGRSSSKLLSGPGGAE